MAARAISMSEKNWYKEDREAAGAHDHLVIVRPEDMEVLEELPKCMTVQQVAEFFQVSTDTIYRWGREYQRSKGKRGLRIRLVGTLRRVFRDDLAAYLAILNAAQSG